ncbi:hypothetical protein [Candidatus Ichthyocystis sparus]|uniref:hypothetical protein n=1 Tax=Candidatus Ichthyocystis sparus TaxID=1561004 RepID=UPI000B826D92|nr:hypothetical protein [Candidatus Ichthyocystis sparus]
MYPSLRGIGSSCNASQEGQSETQSSDGDCSVGGVSSLSQVVVDDFGRGGAVESTSVDVATSLATSSASGSSEPPIRAGISSFSSPVSSRIIRRVDVPPVSSPGSSRIVRRMDVPPPVSSPGSSRIIRRVDVPPPVFSPGSSRIVRRVDVPPPDFYGMVRREDVSSSDSVSSAIGRLSLHEYDVPTRRGPSYPPPPIPTLVETDYVFFGFCASDSCHYAASELGSGLVSDNPLYAGILGPTFGGDYGLLNMDGLSEGGLPSSSSYEEVGSLVSTGSVSCASFEGVPLLPISSSPQLRGAVGEESPICSGGSGYAPTSSGTGVDVSSDCVYMLPDVGRALQHCDVPTRRGPSFPPPPIPVVVESDYMSFGACAPASCVSASASCHYAVSELGSASVSCNPIYASGLGLMLGDGGGCLDMDGLSEGGFSSSSTSSSCEEVVGHNSPVSEMSHTLFVGRSLPLVPLSSPQLGREAGEENLLCSGDDSGSSGKTIYEEVD